MVNGEITIFWNSQGKSEQKKLSKEIVLTSDNFSEQICILTLCIDRIVKAMQYFLAILYRLYIRIITFFFFGQRMITFFHL